MRVVGRAVAVSPSPATRSERGGGARPRPREGLSRDDRLRRRAEFREVQTQGRRVHTRHFILVLLPREDQRNRLGVTVTKKVGTAVQRNRVKRLVREVFRRNRDRFPEGCDVVAIAKRGAPELGYDDVSSQITGVERAMRSALEKARARREQQG